MLKGTKGTSRAASVAALMTAAGAVACGVCCVLPFAWPAVAAAGTGSALAWLGRAQDKMTLVALLIVASAWLAVGVQSRRSRTRPARTTIHAMSAATLVLILAILWPRLEPFLIRQFGAIQ